MHFTPTGCSWLNMVERFFRDLTENRLRRGAFRSIEELIITVIFDYIDHHNESPKPFIWTSKAPTYWRRSSVLALPFIIANLHDALH
jgi:transposase